MRSILNEKMALELEKRIMEDDLNKTIEAPKREKMEMEERFCEANKEKNEKMKRILNENVVAAIVQADKTVSMEEAKKNLELGNRIDFLEREKQGLEPEIRDKDEVIKVIAEENNCLEDMKSKLKLENSVLCSKLKEAVSSECNDGMLTISLQSKDGWLQGINEFLHKQYISRP